MESNKFITNIILTVVGSFIIQIPTFIVFPTIISESSLKEIHNYVIVLIHGSGDWGKFFFNQIS